MNLTYALKEEETKKAHKVQNLLIDQMMDHPMGHPEYYGVCFYRKSFEGGDLTPEDHYKRWNINEVRKTHKFIARQIHKCFGKDIPLWFFINRHQGQQDISETSFTFGSARSEEEYIARPNKQGSFHTDLYVGEIPDEAIANPSPSLLEYFYKEDQSGIPIDSRQVGIDGKKLLLLEAVIRTSKWIGRHPKSLNLHQVPKQEMEEKVICYGLKDLTTLEDLDSIVDFDNSYFYTPSKEKT